VVVPGANATLTALTDAERSCISGARILLLQLESPLAAVTAAAEAAQGLVVLNAAPAMEVSRQLLRHVDVLVVNETEPAALASLIHQVPIVVTTLGAAGVVLRRHGLSDLHVPARVVRVIDTTAAGDTFCGVMAAALARGLSWQAALERATAAASLAVQRSGAQSSMPTTQEIYEVVAGFGFAAP
jgi:ribokinase